MTRFVGVVSLVTLGAVALSAQPQRPAPTPAAAGVVSGSVVSAETGQPIRNAPLRLISTAPAATHQTTSDGDGKFVFSSVPAGTYTLSGSKGGYLEMVYGARRPGASMAGTPIQIAAAQKIERLELKLPRGSVITGTVTDEYGDVAFNTAVRILRYVYSNGERYGTSNGQQDFTDDRGVYRIAGLMPGDYIVSAVPQNIVSQVMTSNAMARDRYLSVVAAAKAAGRDASASALGFRPDAEALLNRPIDPRGYVPVHYPGSVLTSGAAPVHVGLSDEVSGIDIRLQVLQTANVTGTVTWAGGTAPAGARIQLLDPQMPMPTLGSWWTGLRPGAKFVFYGVSPGAYVVRVSTSEAGSDLFATADIQVDPSRTNEVELSLQRGMSVSGSIALEGAPVTFSRLHVILEPVSMIADPEMGRERVAVDAAGRFVIRGLVPARYRFSIEGLPAGWSLGSAMFGDRDAVDQLLEMRAGVNLTGGVLKLTSKLGEIAGAVTNAASQPVVNAMVIVFPEDRRLWVPKSPRIQTSTLSPDGRYTARGLPPGDYRIAVADPEPQQWFDIEYLTQLLPAATPVALALGDKKQLDLRVK
jgi:carboxypeptidase family protein